MASISAQTGELQSKGEQFEQYGTDLLELLKNIDTNVQQIASEGLKGSATDSLLDTYETISNVITNYAQKIADLGTVIKASATAKENVNEAAAQAAGANV